jgi:predicted GNAT family N-acyltransferase
VPSDYTFNILGPDQNHSAVVLRNCGENGQLHHRYLSAMQRLRGRVYLCDGAIRPYEVELDGRFEMDGDEDAWHLLLVDDAGEIIGCARYMIYPKTACFNSLRISRSALARDLQWAWKLRQAVEADLQLARDRNLLYVEIGGWALSEEWRRTKAALETAVGSYALGNLWGGALGSCTATVRHGSASILRRLGGSSFQFKGEPLPVYFDAQYGCNMELLRFEDQCPVSRFEPLIKQLTSKLERVQVITASSYSLFVPPQMHSSLARVTECVSQTISDDSALQGHGY